MRNALVSSFDHDKERATSTPLSRHWRVWLPGALLLTGLVAVFTRVAWIQGRLSGEYLAALQVTTTDLEVLPAVDGRILADGVVLAADEPVQHVQMHYRWLQREPDEYWLTRQIRSRLSRSERRDESLVQAVEQEVRQQRQQMLATLARVCSTTEADLRARCDGVQERVERIISSVNRRHGIELTPLGTQLSQDQDDYPPEEIPWLFQLAGQVRKALTTPPRRQNAERIIIREEESWHTVLEDVDSRIATLIAEYPDQFPGVRIQQTSRRIYPHPNLAVHVVGARTAWRADDEAQQIPVDHPRGQGRFGLEKFYDSRISGQPGIRRVTRDRRQRVIAEEIVRQPRAGQDLHLTLDFQLQQHAEKILAEALGDLPRHLLAEGNGVAAPSPPQEQPEIIPVGGSVVVMDVRDGRLLSLASAPDFDLGLFTGGTEEQWKIVNSDTRRPFVSRFAAMAIPPGSTWKPFTALAALESGTLDPAAEFFCQGYLDRPDELRCLLFRRYGVGHGPISLRQAMTQSCNVYFFEAARTLGGNRLVDWGIRLGFGSHTGIDLPFERPGNLPGTRRLSEDDGRLRLQAIAGDANLADADLSGLAIGQSRLTVTPLQMARGLAAIANGGSLVTPHLVSAQSSSLPAPPASASPGRSGIAGIDAATLQHLQQSLEAVVQSPNGTAHRGVFLPGVRIAGKTGTAETGPGKPDHAWFAGYFPADKPQYVVVVALENGGSGGNAAGPAAREIIRFLVQKEQTTTQLSLSAGKDRGILSP